MNMIRKWIVREIVEYVDEDARGHRIDTAYSVMLPDPITPLDIYRIVRPEKIEVDEHTTRGLEIFSFVEKHEYGNDEVRYKVCAFGGVYNMREEIDFTRKIISTIRHDDPYRLVIPTEEEE